MRVQMVPIDAVIPYARNPRRNGEAVARAGLAEAAERMGGSLVGLRQAAGGVGGRGMWYGMAVMEGPPA